MRDTLGPSHSGYAGLLYAGPMVATLVHTVAMAILYVLYEIR